MKMSFRKTLISRIALTTIGMVVAANAWAVEPIEIGQTFLTRGIEPTKGSNGWALVSHGIGENLFTVDEAGSLVPQLGIGAKRLNELTWEITLASGRMFSDGSPVTAKALTFGFERVFTDNKAALATGGELSFEAVSELALKVTTEKPVR